MAEPAGTLARRAEARRCLSPLILPQTCAISDEKFCGPEKFRFFSVRNSPENAPKRTRHVMPTHGRACRDTQRSCRGLASSGRSDFAANLRDLGRKFLRPRKFSIFFGPRRAQKSLESRTPRHADARQSLQGPSKVAPRPGVVWPR